ncbi:MAG: hypothetical protein PF637_05320 [Spirochaetes bacterium]|nr:hypothetical protein [Spirochaetota bacterium]
MKLRKNDSLFFTVCILILVIASLRLCQDIRQTYVRDTTEQIGTITFKKRIAERKFTSQVLWGSVENHSPVYNYDSIRTDFDSIATVNLDDGTAIELGENTLVVLSMRNNELSINMEGSSLNLIRDLSGSKGALTSSVTVISGDTTVSMREGSLLFSGDGSGTGFTGIDVASGEAEIVVDGKTIVLANDRAFRADGDGETRAIQIAYTLSTPKASAVFITAESVLPVVFSWKPEDDLSKNLIIARDPLFKKISVTRDVTSETSTEISVEPGSYFWKIVGSGKESRVSRFTVLKDKASLPLMPPKKKKINAVSEKPLVSFNWTKSDYATNYQIEIFSDADLKNRVLTLPSRGTAISTDKLGGGTYYWRVKNDYGHLYGGENLTGKTSQFTIVQESGLSKPDPVSRRDEVERISRLALKEKKQALYWHSKSGVDYYTVEISTDENFTDVVANERVNYNFYRPSQELINGDYFWRVKAHSKKISSEFSEERRFIIVDAVPIELLAPATDTVLTGRSVDVFFRWRDYNRGNNYLVQLSKSDDFTAPLLTGKSRTGNVVVNGVSPSEYYWRVILKSDDDKDLVVSETASFRILTISPSPTLLSPKPGLVVNTVEEKSIDFTWETVDSATHYKVVLYKKAFPKRITVHEKTVSETGYTYDTVESLKKGEYEFEITALHGDSSRNTVVSKTTRGAFSVITLKKLAVPRVKLPSIIIDTE